MRRSPFPIFNSTVTLFCFITSLFFNVWAAPSPKESDSRSNGSKKGVPGALIALAVVGPIVLILACFLVHHLVRRYVDNMHEPQPVVVVDLEKEFNSDNVKAVAGAQGPGRDVASWARNVRTSVAVPGGNWNGPSDSSHDRSASASTIDEKSSASTSTSTTTDEIPPGLQPGVRHSTASRLGLGRTSVDTRQMRVSGWGRQSVEGGQMRLSPVLTLPKEDGLDFRISYWYTEPTQPTSPRSQPLSPRPLVATPRGPREPTRKSRHDWNPLATIDSRSDETATRRNDSTHSRSSLMTSSESHR